MVVDARGMLWMGWGKTLSRYDPQTNSIESWNLPPLSSFAVRPFNSAMDGNIVSIASEANAEIWVAIHSVQELVGFSVVSGSWDRTVSIPVVPGTKSRLDVGQSSALTLNGSVFAPSGTTPSPALAVINTATGLVSSVWPNVVRYVRYGADKVLYVDNKGGLGEMTLSSGFYTAIAQNPAITTNADLVTDSTAGVWFAAMGYRFVGVGRVDISTGTTAIYPLPAVTAGSGPAPACGGAQCVPPDAVFDPGIQAVIVDSRNDVWAITTVPGTGAGPVAPATKMTPAFELAAQA